MCTDEAPAGRLIVNWIEVEDGTLRLGATDDRLWRWTVEDGGAGGDARTHVLVTLRALRGGRAPHEAVELFCAPDLPERSLVMAELPALTDLAHALWREQPEHEVARARCFGVPVAVALGRMDGTTA